MQSQNCNYKRQFGVKPDLEEEIRRTYDCMKILEVHLKIPDK